MGVKIVKFRIFWHFFGRDKADKVRVFCGNEYQGILNIDFDCSFCLKVHPNSTNNFKQLCYRKNAISADHYTKVQIKSVKLCRTSNLVPQRVFCQSHSKFLRLSSWCSKQCSQGMICIHLTERVTKLKTTLLFL